MRFWYSSTRVPFCRAMFSVSSSSLRSVSSRRRLATSFTIVTADSGRVSASFIHSSILWEKDMVRFLEQIIILEGQLYITLSLHERGKNSRGRVFLTEMGNSPIDLVSGY